MVRENLEMVWVAELLKSANYKKIVNKLPEVQIKLTAVGNFNT